VVVAGLLEQVAPIEQQSRIDVPRHAERASGNDVRVPDAGVVVGRRDRGRHAQARIERLQRIERGKLRDPRVAELADVRQGAGDECGQQPLVCRRPWDLLERDLDLPVPPLELRQQAREFFSLAPHRPDAQFAAIRPRARAREQGCAGGAKKPAPMPFLFVAPAARHDADSARFRRLR
jgi:hypothetical protein